MATESVTHEVVIKRPISEVFAYVEDVSNMPKYLKVVRDVETVSGAPGEVGYTIRVVSNLIGKRMENESKLVQYEQNRRTVYRGEKPFPMEIKHDYEETAEGATKLTRTTSADLQQANFFFKMAGPMITKSTSNDTQEGLVKLKEILES